MLPRSQRFLLPLLLALWAAADGSAGEAIPPRPKVPGMLRLHLRQRRVETPGSGRFKVIERTVDWDAAATAIIVCDMWDGHYCKRSAQRVRLMVPRMNEVLTAARDRGVTIIHAPSGCMEVYAGTLPRRRMQQAKAAKSPRPLEAWCDRDPKREPPLPVDVSKCACDDAEVGPAVRKFSRQHPGLDVTDCDGVSDSGQEIFNFCAQEGIRNVVLMGVHTNMCVLGRSFGIRQMVKLGKNVVLARDLTDAMYDPRQPPYVSHTRGTEMVIEHIEKYWCASILGKDLTTVVPGSADPPAPVVYVSVMGKKVIAAYRLDRADGTLTHSSDARSDGEAGALTTDPQRRFLFAALRSTGKLSSFRIGAAGKLTAINTVEAGADPAYVATDSAGHYLLTAYYLDGKVTVHAIGKDGSLGEKPVQTVQTAKNAHAVVFDPSGKFVFVPHTGPNVIYTFTFNADSGRLTPAATPRIVTPPGTGPRHLVFQPGGAFAYVVNEQGSSVTAYRFGANDGSLAPLQTVSTLPGDFKGNNACAEIKFHPSGKFLYASNRGHDSIACFRVEASTGKLTAVGPTPTEKTPRSFDLSPDGTFLFAAGESSGKVAAYRVNAKNGDLKRVKTYEVGKTPWWVLVVRSDRPRS